MVIADDIYAMLLTHAKFKTFTKKEIADATRFTEELTALSFESKAKVNDLLETALKAGQSNPVNFRTMGSCTAGASMTSTVIHGRSFGWTRIISRRPNGKLHQSSGKTRREEGDYRIKLNMELICRSCS